MTFRISPAARQSHHVEHFGREREPIVVIDGFSRRIAELVATGRRALYAPVTGVPGSRRSLPIGMAAFNVAVGQGEADFSPPPEGCYHGDSEPHEPIGEIEARPDRLIGER